MRYHDLRRGGMEEKVALKQAGACVSDAILTGFPVVCNGMISSFYAMPP